MAAPPRPSKSGAKPWLKGQVWLYTYVCMYVCVCVSVCVSVCLCACLCLRVLICIYVYRYVYICVCYVYLCPGLHMWVPWVACIITVDVSIYLYLYVISTFVSDVIRDLFFSASVWHSWSHTIHTHIRSYTHTHIPLRPLFTLPSVCRPTIWHLWPILMNLCC